MSETVASPLVVSIGSTASGRGCGQGRGQSDSRGCRNCHNSRETTIPCVCSTFKGNTEERNGHVFQCFNKCEDKEQFSKNVEALGEYVASKNLKYMGDIASLTKDLARPNILKPTELKTSETNRLVVAIWEKKVSAYCTRTGILNSYLTAIIVILAPFGPTLRTSLSEATTSIP